METYQDDPNWSTIATKVPLRTIIVGAGVAGLATAVGLKLAGHDVVILDQLSKIAEVGAGIQIAPNGARILGRFGLLEKMMEKANVVEKNSLRRWQDNEELGSVPLMPKIGKRYKAPLSVIHRDDLQRILLKRVEDLGVDILLNSKVMKADPDFKARVQLSTGEWIEGDVVIAADGIKSNISRQMAEAQGIKDGIVPTGDAAYRILIPGEKMQHDPRARELLKSSAVSRWMGPKGHITAYPIKNNTVYNMVLIHPQRPGSENEESWTHKGDKTEMMDFYSGWCDIVQDLLSCVPEGEVMEWTLNSHRPLPTWLQNQCVLIGDSCHPMLPYVAQGAAQAIEDAGVLTVVLSSIASKDEVTSALQVYEMVRKERGERIQNSAATTRKSLHFADGQEQRQRDAAMKGAGRNPDLWADLEWQDYMWGADVMKDTMTNWDSHMAKAKGFHLPELKAGSF